jgi:hypothetical protein
MNRSVTTPMDQPAAEDQARRAERGIVAGYIHELSQRHDGHRAQELDPESGAEASEGA